MVGISGLLGLIVVALGAFGAHALAPSFDAKASGWWDTATLYGLTHAAAGLAIGLSGRPGLLRLGGWALIGGAALFAATLYAMALGAPRWLGAVTPLGGLGMLLGWGSVVTASIQTVRRGRRP